MDTTVDTPASTTTRSLRRLPRPALYGGLAVLAVLVVCFALLAGLRLARPGALPSVTVGEVEVGGLADEALREAIVRAGRGDVPIVVEADTRVEATGSELGYVLDVDATERAVLRRGRQWNPFAALADHLRAFTSAPIPVALVHDVDDAALDAWMAETAQALSQEPAEGQVAFVGLEIERSDPQPGVAVRVDELRPQLHEALLGDGEREITAPADLDEPDTTVEAVDRAVAQAERAISGPITLTREEASLSLSPEQIAALITFEREGGELVPRVEPLAVSALVDDNLRAALETEPVDARFELSGGAVNIVPAVEGFRFDPDAAAEQVVEVATGDGPREAELAGEIEEPGLTTANAEALNITEQVASFTTNFTAGQSRVTNIHRIADLVNGVVIKPGETFSVNDHVGPRTRAKGFVEGGAIQAGEFVSEVGGGVSQFATTMYNAAYFGGYEIPDYKAHSYYISRYPAGREATLNYPDVDLKVRNNSPHGVLIATSYTATSVTVAFWGTEWVDVETVAGARHNYRDPPTEVEENPDLPEGTERVIQSGRQGFDITVTRILRFPDGREEREDVFTRYLPEPRIVERGTRPPPEEPPGEEDDPPGEDEPPPDDEDDPPGDNGDEPPPDDNGGDDD